MSEPSTDIRRNVPEWGADFFGGLNEMPAEPVAGIGQILDAMATLPAFRDARRWVLQHLDISQGGSVLEAGCGNGGAFPDVLPHIGTGRLVGIDPTTAFVEAARARAAQLGASQAELRVGDIRALPYPAAEFDAVFCDKVLIHAGPAKAALDEMVRVTRVGGHVGAIEWLPFFSISSTRPAALDAFNAIFKTSVYDYFVSANLARHFHASGLRQIRTQAFLAHTDSLDAHPWWRAFVVQQMPMFIHAQLIDSATADAFVADLEALNARHEFSASFVVTGAVGTKND